jgi:hypothetical protein
MTRALLLAAAIAAVAACEKKNETTGLPPATQWKAGDPGAPPGGVAKPADPHAGLDMGAAGAAADPHAGVDMGGGMGGGAADPHAGVDMGGGMGGGMGGAAGPDPSRPVNPNIYLRGKITVSPKVKDKVAAGGAVFLSVKRPDPSTGEGVGMPLAVAKLDLNPTGFAFDLTERDAMMSGTELSGEVVIMARYDQDSDAFTKQPGDVTGKVRATVPAKDLMLVLDSVLP